MIQSLKTCMAFAKRLWRDERGAEGLEKLLIIAAIVKKPKERKSQGITEST